MKTSLVLIVFLIAGFPELIAQSHSFYTLEEKFSSDENVHSFQTSGFLARTVLWLAGEHEFTQAIQHVKNIRVITIPKSAFEKKELTVHGFKRVVRSDNYEELASIRDRGDNVVIYMKAINNSVMNRYLILIDNPDELVAVEIKGYIDADLLDTRDHKLSYKL